MLFKAVHNYEALTEGVFQITYGRNNKITILDIVFETKDFHHMVGLHKLTDIKKMLSGSRDKLYGRLKSGSISCDAVKRSIYYHTIEGSIEIVSNLQEVLKGDLFVYKNFKDGRHMRTTIVYDYLIKCTYNDKIVNMFIKKGLDGRYYLCNSIFYQTTDYVKNVRHYTVLKSSWISKKQ